MVPHGSNTQNVHTHKKLAFDFIVNFRFDNDTHTFNMGFDFNYAVSVVDNSENSYIYNNYGYFVG